MISDHTSYINKSYFTLDRVDSHQLRHALVVYKVDAHEEVHSKLIFIDLVRIYRITNLCSH